MLTAFSAHFKSFVTNRSALLRWIGWFYFGNAVIFWLLGIYYFRGITPLSINLVTHLNAVLVWIFLIATWIGYFALLAFLCSALSITFLIITHKRPIIFINTIILASLAIIILILDMLVYGQYHFHLNSIILHMVFSSGMTEIFDFTWLEKSLLIIAIIVITSLETLFAMWLWRYLQNTQKNLHGKKISATIIVSLFLSYNMYLLSSVQPTSIIYQQPEAFPLYITSLMTLVPKLTQLPDFDGLGYDMIRQPQRPINQKLHYPLNPIICHTKQLPLNIVIIAIDAWRFDMLNQSVTPNINQFAQQSWQFDNHWSGGTTTQPGIFSLFYGIPDNYWSAALKQRNGSILIHQLLQENYQLGIYASAELTLPAFNKTVFVDVPQLQITTAGKLPADRDQQITNQFKQFITHSVQTHRPFFSFLFYDTAHSYCPDFPNDNKFLPIITTCDRFEVHPSKDVPLYFNRYKNALYFDDNLIKLTTSISRL